MKPLVSVVIVSFNTRELTLRSIESVYASKGFKSGQIEVIVVDNGSSDNSVNYLGSNLEQFRLIVNSINKGFGAANNQGAAIARGKYLLFLNSDAFLAKDTLRSLVDTLVAHSDIYSTGPQLQYADGRIQPSAGYLPTPTRVLAWMWGLDKLPFIKTFFSTPYHVFNLNWHTKPQYPDWLMGACILFQREQFLQIGGFDEKIFMYAEEVELYLRLKQRLGKRVYFTPKAQVVHLGGVSSKLVAELKGVEYIYAKHYPKLLWFIRFVIYTGVILRIAVFSLMPSRRKTVTQYLKFFRHS